MTTRPALPVSAALALLLAGCGGQAPEAPRVPPTPPTARDTPPPDYPPLLACRGVGGESVLTISVGADGVPADIRVQRSSHPDLDAAAIEAVKRWQFNPGTANGQPASTRMQVPVRFRPPQLKPDACFLIEEQARRAAQAQG